MRSISQAQPFGRATKFWPASAMSIAKWPAPGFIGATCLGKFCQPANLALRQRMAAEGLYEQAWQSASRAPESRSTRRLTSISRSRASLVFSSSAGFGRAPVFATFVSCNINPTFGRGAVVEWCRAALGRHRFRDPSRASTCCRAKENKALPWAPRAVRAYLRSPRQTGLSGLAGRWSLRDSATPGFDLCPFPP